MNFNIFTTVKTILYVFYKYRIESTKKFFKYKWKELAKKALQPTIIKNNQCIWLMIKVG